MYRDRTRLVFGQEEQVVRRWERVVDELPLSKRVEYAKQHLKQRCAQSCLAMHRRRVFEPEVNLARAQAQLQADLEEHVGHFGGDTALLSRIRVREDATLNLVRMSVKKARALPPLRLNRCEALAQRLDERYEAGVQADAKLLRQRAIEDRRREAAAAAAAAATATTATTGSRRPSRPGVKRVLCPLPGGGGGGGGCPSPDGAAAHAAHADTAPPHPVAAEHLAPLKHAPRLPLAHDWGG